MVVALLGKPLSSCERGWPVWLQSGRQVEVCEASLTCLCITVSNDRQCIHKWSIIDCARLGERDQTAAAGDK